jgi:hypothetical protein
MAKKMYYSDAEVLQKLHVTPEQLAGMVREKKLKAYQDGTRQMFKADDVDALAGGGEDEIELAPAAEKSDIGKPAPAKKEETVITTAGISIFDDEELEIEPADPMAKTQIAPSLEDQLSGEGVSSGSGLLDLTRESDDTSLGAEVLDHIDVEGGVGSSIAAAEMPAADTAKPATVVVMAAPAAEALDASSGLFGGLVVAAAVLAIVVGMVVAAAAQGLMPSYVQAMKNNVPIVMAVVVVVLAAGAVAGWLAGKGAAARQEAMKKMSA